MSMYEVVDGGLVPIDLEYLSQFTANDPDVTREVLQIYCAQAEGWLGSLAGAADLTAWRDAAHTLKGASRGVGALQVAQLAEGAEGLSALDAPERGEHFAGIEDAVARATRYAAQLLEESPLSS